MHLDAARRPVRLALTCLVLAVGCVWPVDINEREEVGLPPVLDWTLVSPSPDQTVELLPSATFSIEGAISDPDTPIENLDVFWYLDFPQGCDTVCKGPFKQGGVADRSILTINHCTSDFKYHATQDNFHLLELIVTDGKVINDNLTGRSIQGGYVYASWWLWEPSKCAQ